MFSLAGDTNGPAFGMSSGSDNETTPSDVALDPIFAGLDAELALPTDEETPVVSSESFERREPTLQAGLADPSQLRDIPFHLLMTPYACD